MAARYERRKAEAIRSLGGRCAHCGSTHALEFDHIDPVAKLFTIARKLAGVSDARLQEELAKCQLLCFDCHLVKTKSEGHGGGKPGEGSNFAKLTECQVLEIRSKYVPRRYTMPMLAAEYGVTADAVKLVIARKTWKHI